MNTLTIPGKWCGCRVLFIYGKKNISFYPGTAFLTEEIALASWTEIINIISLYKAGINMLGNDTLP